MVVMPIPRRDTMDIRVIKKDRFNRSVRPEKRHQFCGSRAVVSSMLPPNPRVLAIGSHSPNVDLQAILVRYMFRIRHTICAADVTDAKLALFHRLPLEFG
jgi:hypothetical protein